MAFHIIRDDLARVCADAIVNTANPLPIYGSGTDRAIYIAAGEDVLLSARKQIGVIKVGEAAYTPAFDLPAKYIIHAVGPEWEGGEHEELRLLRNAYQNSLKLSKELGCRSTAFPLISTGALGFPKEESLRIAVEVFSQFLLENEMEIVLVVFDNESFHLSGKIFGGLAEYIDRHEVAEKLREEYPKSSDSPSVHRTFGSFFRRRREKSRSEEESKVRLEPSFECLKDVSESLSEIQFEVCDEDLADCVEKCAVEIASADDADSDNVDSDAVDFEALYSDSVDAEAANPDTANGENRVAAGTPTANNVPVNCDSESKPDYGVKNRAGYAVKRSLDDVMKQLTETWQESLLRMIDERELSDVEVYKRANMDRKLFSKIRSNVEYQPKKHTAVAFALALRLNADETRDFLAKAGYALSTSNKFDLIISYFIENDVYDIYMINLDLFEHGQALLGSR